MAITNIHSGQSYVNFLQPKVGEEVSIRIDIQIAWINEGYHVHIPKGGIYEVISVVAFNVTLKLIKSYREEGAVISADVIHPVPEEIAQSLISDEVVLADKTWSSEKINTELSAKANLGSDITTGYGISGGSQGGIYTPLRLSQGVQDNLDMSHTHSNKPTLDAITDILIANWNDVFDKKVNAISFTGDTNKTLTVTREDGTTLIASFLDNNDPQLPDDVLNTLSFNDNNDGVLRAVTSEGSIIDASLDGRYSLLGHKHVWADITDRPTSLSSFNNDLGNYGNWITKVQGDGYYAPIAHVGVGGNAHAIATTSVAGFMSSADKTKLNSLSNYTHPSKTWVDKANLTGSTVISNLTINSLGHPTNWTTRTLTPGDIGAATSGHTHTFANLTNKPTTIGGYGITDFNSLGDARWALRTRTITAGTGLTGGGNLTDNRTLNFDTDWGDNRYGTKSFIGDAIDDIEIGGRNYVLGTEIPKEINIGTRFDLSENIVSGSAYTMKLKALFVSGDNNFNTISVRDYSPSSTIIIYLRRIGSTDYFKGTAVLNVSNDFIIINSGDIYSDSQSRIIEVSEIKLEKGNKATDWTPAPEDQVTDWNETDSTKYSFIKNKPTIPTTSDYITTNTNQTGLSGDKTTSGSWTLGQIRKAGQNDTQLLLAGGGHRPVSDFALASSIITAGTGLTGGGNLTANRTIGLSTDTQNDIAMGVEAYEWGNFRNYGLGRKSTNLADITSEEVQYGRIFRSLQSGHVGSIISLPFDGSGSGRTNLFRVYNGNAYISTSLVSEGTAPSWRELWHTSNFTPSNYYTKTESLNQFVGLSGVQDIEDTKTFLDSPVVPNPTLDEHAVNKGYVDESNEPKIARYRWTNPVKFAGIINFPTEIFNSNLHTERTNNNESIFVEEGYYNVNVTFEFLENGMTSVEIFMNGSTQAHRIASSPMSGGYEGCSTSTGVIYIGENDYISVGVDSNQNIEDLVVEISFEKIG